MKLLFMKYSRCRGPTVTDRLFPSLGGDRAAMGLVTALFHDSGYVRESADDARNGAELTTTHVARSARHLARCLPAVGLGAWVEVATNGCA